jgi:hypothetical protein
MKLIQINAKGEASFTSQASTLPSFERLVQSSGDKSAQQLWAKYIYFMADFESPYSVFPEEERDAKIRSELLKNEGQDIPDYVKKCVGLYKELSTSESIRLLESSRLAAHKLGKYFQEVEITDDNVGKVSKSLKEVKDIIVSLNTLEEQVRKEKVAQSTHRGGGNISKREQ